jgi:hypothetical protein
VHPRTRKLKRHAKDGTCCGSSVLSQLSPFGTFAAKLNGRLRRYLAQSLPLGKQATKLVAPGQRHSGASTLGMDGLGGRRVQPSRRRIHRSGGLQTERTFRGMKKPQHAYYARTQDFRVRRKITTESPMLHGITGWWCMPQTSSL